MREVPLAVTRLFDGEEEVEMAVIERYGENLAIHLDDGEVLLFHAGEFEAALRPAKELEAA